MKTGHKADPMLNHKHRKLNEILPSLLSVSLELLTNTVALTCSREIPVKQAGMDAMEDL